MANLDRVMAVAKQALTIQDEHGRNDLWLWEHSARVTRLARMLVQLPEVAEKGPDPDAVAVASLFHDAGWVIQLREGRLDRWQLLSRPTNDIQRELAAGLVQEQTRHLVPADTLRLAAEAIRYCNDRETTLIGAHVLAEAENLDEVGLMYLLRQFRQYQAEGRPIEQWLTGWARQQEYQYWQARINEGFRFKITRELARERLRAADQFMAALARDHEGADVQEALKRGG